VAKRNNPSRGIRLHGATYELNIQRGGRRQFINLETDDFAEAVKRAQQIRLDPDLMPSGGLEQEIARFLAYRKRLGQYTEQTMRGKRLKLGLMARAVPPGRTAATVTPRDLQEWHDGLVGRITSASLHSYMMAARSFFKWAIEAKLRRRNPVADVKIVRLQKRARQSFCSFEQRDRLISCCTDEELRFILYCGFHAGLRFSEIVEAVPMWFDLDHGRVMLRKHEGMQFKDGEERTVPMTREFREFLIAYGLRSPYMIAPEVTKGKWVYRYDFRKKFMTYTRAQALPWVTPHVMRHTFASLLVSAGESIYKVAVWLGDNVSVVQSHYGHLAPDEGGIEKAFSERGNK
jgi:integrase